MSNPDIVTRGATVVFTVSFTDINGDPTNPNSANLYLSYLRNRKRVERTVTMVPDVGDTWVGTWESADADAGQLEWHVRSDSTFTAALQGSFRLDTNKANPDV